MIKIISCSVVMEFGINPEEFHGILNSFLRIFSGKFFAPPLYNGYPSLGGGSKLAPHTPDEQMLYKIVT